MTPAEARTAWLAKAEALANAQAARSYDAGNLDGGGHVMDPRAHDRAAEAQAALQQHLATLPEVAPWA